MTIEGQKPDELHLEVLSDPAKLSPTRKTVESFALQNGFDKDSCCEIGLVVNEAMANIIRHAYHGAADRPIKIDVDMVGDAIRITLRDWGDGVDPSQLPCRTPDPRKPGGLGLVCLKELMDKFEFTKQNDGMLLTMVRNRERSNSASSVA